MSATQLAVSVKGVSKIYRLWRSPRDRLFVPMKQFIMSFWPVKRFFKSEEDDKGYQNFHALSDITFDILKGESWGFIGVNGSGKSTLLKIISGNLRPSTGCVEVDGKVVILDYGSGFNGEFTGKENIYIKATLLGLTRKKINERLDSIINFAELGEFINQPVKTYSSGMVARLGFAIMAHVDADIIITDEALAVGDVFFVQKCMKFIRQFLKKGTFLFVSHSTNDVLSLCQKAVWLEHGQMKKMGEAGAVVRAYLDAESMISAKAKHSTTSNAEHALAENVQPVIVLGQPKLSELAHYHRPVFKRDMRADHSNNINYRNDIEVPEINFDEECITSEKAQIVSASMRDENSTPLSCVIGGELVTLSIEVLAHQDLHLPIVGFQLMDRLGQVLFADNSALIVQEQAVMIKAGTSFVSEFVFQMPLLPVGEYAMRVAIAIQTDEHQAILLHTINTALVLRSVTSGARHGLIGVPMHAITLKCLSDQATPIAQIAV